MVSARESVVLKGGRNGISIVIRDGADFATVISELREKLAPARNFFGGAPVRISAGSRPLRAEERLTLEETVSEYGLTLAEEEEPAPQRPVYAAGERAAASCDTMLHKRTLRSGQRIDFGGNVVVLGDVNPGAVIR
jgi:septum site-determining protein MinC